MVRLHQQARHQARSFKRKKQEREGEEGVQERCLGIGWEFAMFLLGDCGESLRLLEGATTGGMPCAPYNIGRPHPHTR